MDTNISKYLALIETIEQGSITKAAEKLNYSQSGISRMLQDLEKEWNFQILERNRSGVKLTSDGLRIIKYIKSVCDEHSKLQMEINEINGLESGIVRIAAFSSVATHWLPEIVANFEEKYPNIDYEIIIGDYPEIEEWIRSGRVDCGFLSLPTGADLQTRELKKDRLMAVLPKNHPLAGYKNVPIKEIVNYPFMLLQKGVNAEVERVLADNDVKLKVHFTSWDDYSIMAMVEKGLGISILPELILQRMPYEIEIRPLDVPAFRTIGFAVKDDKTLSKATRKFIEYVV